MFDIVLHQNHFGDGDVQQTIDGRDIHAALEIGRHYSTWVQDQIGFHKFRINVNYIKDVPEIVENPQGGRPSTEYFFTIEAAKHIALTSRTEKGRLYRQALIDMEKQVSSGTLIIQNPNLLRTPMAEAIGIVKGWKELAHEFHAPEYLALIEASKQVKLLGIDTTPLLQASTAMDNIPDNQEMLEPTELAKRLGFSSGRAMNKMLAEMGLQARINGEWVPTDAAAGMFFKHSWTKGSKSGCNLKWNLSMIKAKLEAYTESYGSI